VLSDVRAIYEWHIVLIYHIETISFDPFAVAFCKLN